MTIKVNVFNKYIQKINNIIDFGIAEAEGDYWKK